LVGNSTPARIVYTFTDEAQALATYSFLLIVLAFTIATNVSIMSINPTRGDRVMADLIKHSEIVQKLLQDYAALSGDDPAVAIELIFDTVRDNSYQLVHVG
jgi:isocitrate dehydrogenase